MPIAALVPKFRDPGAITTPIVTPGRLQQLWQEFQAACTGTPERPVDAAACTAAYSAWQDARTDWEEQQATFAGRGLPAWLTERPGGPEVAPGAGAGLSFRPASDRRRPPGRDVRPPRPDRPGRRYRPLPPSRFRRPGRGPRPPAGPRPPVVARDRFDPRYRPGGPLGPDAGYNLYCMSSKAPGWVCTGETCVGHHEDVVARLAKDIPWLKYELTTDCENCGGAGCSATTPSAINCQPIVWYRPWVRPPTPEEEVQARARARRRRRPKPPRGYRFVQPPRPGRPDILVPRGEGQLTATVNCWCLPKPFFLYPPGRMRCFAEPYTPESVGLGNMWIYNPRGFPCPE